MKFGKNKKVRIVLCNLFICVMLIITLISKFTKEEADYNLYDSIHEMPKEYPLKEQLEDKLIPFGKVFEHEDYSIKIEGVYVNEETLERAFYVIVDGKEDFTEEDYCIDDYFYSFMFHRNEDGSYRYRISSFVDDEYYYEIVNGNIHYYCMDKAESDVNKRENFCSISFVYDGISSRDESGMTWSIMVNLSEGLQYYNVNGNDVVVTNYGIIANKDFEIKTLQAYLQGGESVFESEEVDINASTVKNTGEHYVYSYSKTDAMKVEYIEVNGKKYYPEK